MADRAFTILELLAVVAILALLGTLAGVSIRGVAAQASIDDVVARITAFDAGARTYAERFGRPVTMTITPHAIEQRHTDEEAGLPEREPLRLSTRYTLTPVGAGDEMTDVRISSDGRSRTYAVEVARDDGLRRVLVIAGLSGRATVTPTAEDAAAILEIERGVDVAWIEEAPRGEER